VRWVSIVNNDNNDDDEIRGVSNECPQTNKQTNKRIISVLADRQIGGGK